jgi:hypothetical protein
MSRATGELITVADILTTQPDLVAPGRPILVQAHLQRRDDITKTEWLGQGEFATVEEVHPWAAALFERQRERIESGEMMPMICTEGAPCFVKAAPQPAAQADTPIEVAT